MPVTVMRLSDVIAPGHKLDALLAEKFMGWEHDTGGWWWTGPNRTPFNHMENKWIHGISVDWDREWLPEFSTDRKKALRLLDHWEGDYTIKRRSGVYYVTLFRPSEEFDGSAESLKLAICRAAITSTGVFAS